MATISGQITQLLVALRLVIIQTATMATDIGQADRVSAHIPLGLRLAAVIVTVLASPQQSRDHRQSNLSLPNLWNNFTIFILPPDTQVYPLRLQLRPVRLQRQQQLLRAPHSHFSISSPIFRISTAKMATIISKLFTVAAIMASRVVVPAPLRLRPLQNHQDHRRLLLMLVGCTLSTHQRRLSYSVVHSK